MASATSSRGSKLHALQRSWGAGGRPSCTWAMAARKPGAAPAKHITSSPRPDAAVAFYRPNAAAEPLVERRGHEAETEGDGQRHERHAPAPRPGRPLGADQHAEPSAREGDQVDQPAEERAAEARPETKAFTRVRVRDPPQRAVGEVVGRSEHPFGRAGEFVARREEDQAVHGLWRDIGILARRQEEALLELAERRLGQRGKEARAGSADRCREGHEKTPGTGSIIDRAPGTGSADGAPEQGRSAFLPPGRPRLSPGYGRLRSRPAAS